MDCSSFFLSKNLTKNFLIVLVTWDYWKSSYKPVRSLILQFQDELNIISSDG